MSSTLEIITKLQRKFEKRYTKFLFAPKFIQDVLYIETQLRLEGAPEPLNIQQLCDKVTKGVERSLLVLGDSGSGKTSFGLKLCETLWGKAVVDGEKIIPIYVYLPRLVAKVNQNESEFDFVKIIVEEFGIHGIEECEGRIIFILDSFDEISSFRRRSRIVQNIWTNTSSWIAQVSVLTCARPEAVPKSKRQEMFEFVEFCDAGNRKYSEYILEGLSGDTILSFLDKLERDIIPQLKNKTDEELTRWSAWGTLKSKIQNWKSGDYNQWFQDIPDLTKLSENPYILTLICQALPGIVNKLKHKESDLKKLCKTRVGIFHSFTEQIFEYQANRVSQRPDNLKPGADNISYRDWLIYFRAYAQNLAGKWFDYANDESVVKMSDRKTLDPSLVEPVLKITQLEKLEKIHKDLFPPRLIHYEKAECRTVANASNPTQIENMKLLRDACNGSILVYSVNKKNENEYTFIHRSMFEYFASEQAFESSLAEYDLILGQTMDNSSAIYGETGFGRALIKDRDILSQLVERMSFEYKKILFKLIRVSKSDSKLHRISANAITILNKANVCFCGLDYRDIQIQGADLRQSICAHTDFRGANLTSVQFGESYLVGAQFQGACMENVDFGEFPILKMPSELNSMVSYREQGDVEDNWVIATADGAVRIWNASDVQLVLPKCRNFGKGYIIDTRISLLHGKLAVWAERTNSPLIPLCKAMVSYEVSLYDLLPKWKFVKKHTLQTTECLDLVHVQFCLMDKCVFVYSTCHLEVLSYLPTSESDNKTLVTIGNEDPGRILTFVSIVDKNEDILVACRKYWDESKGVIRIVVYRYNEDNNRFQVVHNISARPFSGGKLEFLHLTRILFKPDGTGLAIYDGPNTYLQIHENYSEIITPVHSGLVVFTCLAFDRTGKYLAGAIVTTHTIMIWNVPSGTIHRQFEFSTMLFLSRFSTPFAFSSDSKVLALGGRESNTEIAVKLKLIDEDPFIHDLFGQKSVDDLAVSDDGQIVVIVGVHYHTSSKHNYIEIFNYPFQRSAGLYVQLPKAIRVDRCLIGITSSNNSTMFKKIVVIQKTYYRAIVICSHTGKILQIFRFEETLDVNTDHLACVNKQASLCCIYLPTQGCLFWEIFENDNFDITFQGKTELKVLNEVNLNVKELRFDYTGRYLQIVYAPRTHKSKTGKIILFNTEDKIRMEINIPLSSALEIPIKSVDTDMSNNIIFSCISCYLNILIDPFDAKLCQRVEYDFSYSIQLHFDPFSGWLFATTGLPLPVCHCSVVIFTKELDQWDLAVEIPIWFQVEKCVIYEKNDNICVLVGGEGDLCYIEFDKGNCHSWRLLWSMRDCHVLKLLNTNVNGALCLSKRNIGVLKGLGANGEPHQNMKSQYLPFSDWCQEIFGTARSKFHSPFVKTAQNNFILSEDMWVISLVGNVSKLLKWRAHVYIIVEGIKNNRRFVTRIHLTYSKKLKEVSIVVTPLVDRTHTPLNDNSWEDSKYIEFVHLAHKLSAQQYSMSRGECEQFLRNIQTDIQVKLNYNWLRKNCGVWCEKHLNKLGREVHLEGFTSALIFPRVLQLLNEMRFRKKSKKKINS